jgi:membrane associated rhomboid family serine protease
MFGERPPQHPATRILIIANVAIFLLQYLLGPMGRGAAQVFALTGEGLSSGAIWQVVTYQFLHGNLLHLLVNMVALWFAGRELEVVVGTRRFVALYFIGGIVGGLLQTVFSPSDMPLIGASASVCAVMLALTTLFPRMPITALLFFVLPVRMRARTLGYILVGASVFFLLFRLMPGVGHLAHLGGFATGWIFGRAYRPRFGDGFGWTFRNPFTSRPPGGSPEIEVISPLRTVDEIIDKVMRHGIESLTRDERRVLEESRSFRRRR